jgi:hypothetical protein
MNKPDEYKAIVRWGKLLGSFPYYIKAEQEQAAKENAPLDAIFRRDDGTWALLATYR